METGFVNKVLVLTLFRRPEYTKRTLDVLAQCYGIEDYSVHFACDYDFRYADECQKVQDLALDWHAAKKVQVHIGTHRTGIDEMKLQYIPLAFLESDFVVVLEDDMLPAKDFLRFMEWGNRNFKYSAGILSVCGYNRHAEMNLADLYRIWDDECFHAWGWGMWRDRWERFFGNEAAEYRVYAGELVNGKFDYYLSDMAKKHHLQTVMPVIARIQNFGEKNGEHTIPSEFLANDYNAAGAWDLELRDPHAADVWSYV